MAAPAPALDLGSDPSFAELLAQRPQLTRHAHDGLVMEDVPLKRIAEVVGTPTWVYSAGTLRRRARALRAALADAGLTATVHFATKANDNLSVLALLGVYTRKLLEIAVALPTDPRARTFAAGVLLAFLPAAIIGALAHGFIKGVLFNPLVICIALIVGGFVLIAMDERRVEPRYTDATAFPLQMYLLIGLCQCLAMIPGVSRSGATIVSAMLLGADKRSAAEFSFFLAMPTMAGAFAYELYKNYKFLDLNDAGLIAVGFVTALISGIIVVRGLLGYVSRHGFAPFGWWRIGVGSAGLAAWFVWG
jgi:undecaprenyl-diphosphatase